MQERPVHARETFRRMALAGASLAVMAVSPMSARAQEAATAQADEMADSGVADIIVTAQRRQENLQRSSLAINVVSADEMARAGVADARELNRVVPSVQIGQSGSFTQVFVRGVGSSSANQFGDPSVTFNQDGVVIDRPNMVGPLFYDIARVEVLKGPQGTLYGRNATGGAVNVITQAPTQELGGFASAQYGNYNAYALTGAVNIPASDALAFRASAQFQGRDSYLKGGFPVGSSYRDTISQAGRLQALFTPSDDVSLRVMGEISHDTGPGDNFVLLTPNEPGSDPWLGAANPVANASITSAAPAQILLRTDDDALDRDLWSIGAEFKWNMGFATLTVLPAYRDLELHSVSYDGGLRLQYDEKSKQTSVEARLSNEGDRLKWLVGVFYFNNDRNVRNFIDSNPISQRSLQIFPKIGSESWAGFADATFSVTDRLRVLGGIRYTTERKTVKGNRFDLDNTPTNNFVLNNDRRFNQTTWRAGLEFDVAQQSMAYATVATGFKSGGFYTAISPGNQFEPERLTAYTVGIRNRFLDNKLQLNLEGFYWDYKDNQQSSIGFDPLGNVAFVTRNAGNATLYGVSVDAVARVTQSDTISLNAEYNHTKFDRFTYQVPGFFNTNTTGCLVGPVASGRRTVDCSGFAMPRAPRFSARASYAREFELGGGASALFNASGNYQSSKYLSVDYLPQGRVGSTFTADLDLTYRASENRFSISAFLRNLTNEAVYTGGGQHQQIAKMFYANINPPRTYGVRAQVNF